MGRKKKNKGPYDEIAKRVEDGLVRSSLRDLFQEYSASGGVLSPDTAMKLLSKPLGILAGNCESEQSTPTDIERAVSRVSPTKMLRELHHYAVDLYYHTYFDRKGAPPHNIEYLSKLLMLREAGESTKAIAEKLYGNPTPQDVDRTRKQLETAEKRIRRS